MSPRSAWQAWADAESASIRDRGRWRTVRDFDALGPTGRLAGSDGRVVSFASNDYLGLTAHPAVVAAAHAALDRWGTGAGASRLITGARSVHRELEAALAGWKGCEAALLFSTGFAANLGVLATFGGAGVTICSDELNHASIVDGCRLAHADVRVWRHGDVAQLDELLASCGRSIVVSDSVFSMDGDEAPVSMLAEVCARHDALLVLDDAHAVLGPEVDPADVAGGDVLRVGTLSKSLGALGGFVAGPRPFVELLVNRARPFIFTTAPTPADTAAALAALSIVRSAEGDALRARLRSHVERIRPGHPSPIVPIVLGDEDTAVAASSALLGAGVFVPAIRPPTVAPGTSRLRVALSAAHTDADLDLLERALAGLHAVA